MFLYSSANSNYKVIFPHLSFIFLIFIFHILNIHKIYMMNTILQISTTVIKVIDFSEKFNFPWNKLYAIVFVFFTRTTQNQSGIIK